MSSLKENKMGVMPVGKLLFQMALPLAISMLVQALYNVVDSVFVSRISDENNFALTAVSLAFPVQNIMIGIATGVAVGVNALGSRALGEKRQDYAGVIARNGLVLSLIGTILAALFGLFGAEAFMRSQSSNEAVIAYGVDYIRVITIVSFGIFGTILMERLLQSTGRTKYTFYTQGLGAVINIILDPIFIFGLGPIPRMEVTGAAVATVIGQIASLILGIYLNVKKNPEIPLRFQKFRPSGKVIGKILGIGVPSMIMVAIGSLMYYCMNLILGRFDALEAGLGETGTTAFGAYFKLQSFVFMPIFGLSNALLAIVAYNYGARKADRIVGTIRCGCFSAFVMMSVGLLIFQLFPETLLGFFNPDEALLKVGVPTLRSLSLPFIPAGVCIIFGNVFQAMGKSVYSMITSIARQIGVLIPAAYLLSLTDNIDAVWYAFPIAEIASLTISIWMMMSIYRKKIRPLRNSACNSQSEVV